MIRNIKVRPWIWTRFAIISIILSILSIILDLFQLLPLPTCQGQTNECPVSVLQGMDDQSKEKSLEGLYGKVEIMDERILRDMPECDMKAGFRETWFRNYSDFFEVEEMNHRAGTIGIKFSNGSLLSPDYAVWTKDRINLIHVAKHMYQTSRIPNLVFECVWRNEVYHRRKGVDKIINYYLSDDYMGAIDDHGEVTLVNEAWLLVVPEETRLQKPSNIKSKSRTPSYLSRISIPILNSALNTFVCQLFDFVSHPRPPIDDNIIQRLVILFFRWLSRYMLILFPILAPKNGPPIDLSIPYLVVYFRNRGDPLYYHFEMNHLFVPPLESIMSEAPAVSTNAVVLS